MRVVSLTCSNTEIVCALGCAELLVGVDNHSDYPVEVVKALPRVGPDLFIDIERVAALKPDLVLASLTVPGHEKVLAGLEAAGLPYVAPEPVSLDDVYRDIEDISARLGVPSRGRALSQELRRSLAPTPRHERPPRILVEWWPKPVIVPGKQSWVTDLLHLAGGDNPWRDRDVKSEPITDDQIDGMEIDAVVISWCGVATEKYRPRVVERRSRWQHLSALRQGHIYCVPEAHLGRPGPRLEEGFLQLRQVVERCRADAS